MLLKSSRSDDSSRVKKTFKVPKFDYEQIILNLCIFTEMFL